MSAACGSTIEPPVSNSLMGPSGTGQQASSCCNGFVTSHGETRYLPQRSRKASSVVGHCARAQQAAARRQRTRAGIIPNVQWLSKLHSCTENLPNLVEGQSEPSELL
eukprot:scpid103469/ scgid17204/ 